MIIKLECPQCHSIKEMNIDEIDKLINEADIELDENPNDREVLERRKEYTDYQKQNPDSKIFHTTLEIQDFGSSTKPHDITASDFEKAGLKAKNYDCSNGHVCTWYIDESTGRACVKLTRSTTGEYNDANDNNGVAESTGC